MPSAFDTLASSVHRALLGGLLAILALVALGWIARLIGDGSYLPGAVGALVAVGAAYWILSLFREGLRER
jgi:Na+-translocating ferredoxin:NAD+ oxidoreductase RnfE subunit